MNPLASLPSERFAVVGNIDPDAYAAGTVTTGWVAAKNFHSFLALIQVGDMVATSVVDAKVQQATDAAGTGAKDVTGSAIAQLTQAGGDDNKQALINVRTEDLDVDGEFAFIRLSVTIGVAGSDLGAVLFGVDPRNGPASDFDATTVDEIKST